MAYESKAYRTHFGWIDNIKEVEPALASILDERLVDALRASNLDGMHLANSDIVEWENVAGFNFTRGPKGGYFLELALEHYLEVVGDKLPALTLENLHRHKVRIKFADTDDLRDMWSVYQCLVWETEVKNKNYALFDGRWFEIASGYATQVRKFAESIADDALQLPEAAPGDEEEYNKAVEQSEPARYALLDRQTVRPEDAATPIEFCDLLSIGGHLVHVKKRSSSATLSHLFAQGSVSCDLFLRDPTVRKEVRAKLRGMKKAEHEKLIPLDKPQAPNFHVVYAILAKEGKSWPPRLPFFSAVNLKHHANRIQNLGFKVSLQHVKQK